MDVCVHGGLHCRRMAGASKWTKSGLSGPSSSSCLLFRGPKNGAKNRPQKRGRNIAGRRQGFQNGGPVSGTRVLHTPSAPLCVQWVTETPEPFVCFSWQRAWQSLIQVLQYIIIYIYYIYIWSIIWNCLKRCTRCTVYYAYITHAIHWLQTSFSHSASP